MLFPLNTHESHKSYCAYSFNVCSNHTTFKLQRTRIQNKQFAVYYSEMSVTLNQSQGHLTYNNNVDPTQVIVMRSLKDFALMVSEKKPTLKYFFSKRGNMLSPLNMRGKKKNSGIFMICLRNSSIVQKIS